LSAVDVARRYSDAVRAKDWETAASLLDADVEIVPPSGRAYGLRELRAAWGSPGFDHLEVALEDRVFEPDGVSAALMRASQVFRWKEDGAVAYTRQLQTRYEVGGGVIRRIEITME
jgi:hypothetical protein